MWRFNEIQHLSLESLREPMTCPDLRAGNQFGQSPITSRKFFKQVTSFMSLMNSAFVILPEPSLMQNPMIL